MNLILTALALFFIVGTLLPLARHDHWIVRIFDFPRMQIVAGGLVVTGLYVTLGNTSGLLGRALMLALLLCVAYQFYKMFPYTPLAPRQVQRAPDDDEASTVTLLIANLLMDNRRFDRLRAIVDRTRPDVLVVVEPDHWWEQQLRSLSADYPHVVAEPLDNAYGMMVLSRLPLIDPTVEYLVEPDVPSIHTQVELPSGTRLWLHALHPKPPYPDEDVDTTERDAELLLVGRHVRDRSQPTVVAGDLNDVAWSYTTTLFQQVSGLLDPRLGRGMYNTFHAEYPWLRYPLDHVFHSHHFKLVRFERLPYWGSDHFPILVRLKYEAGAAAEQAEPVAEADEDREAEEKIQSASRSSRDHRTR